MDPATIVSQVVAVIAAGVGGWHLRRSVEPEAPTCQCSCACHCSCELGLSTGSWLIFLVLSGLGLVGILIYYKSASETPLVTPPSKGKRGVFGGTGKLSILG